MAENKINLSNYDKVSESICNQINEIVESGKTAKVVVTQWRDKRSCDQNALMWMWYQQMSHQIKQKGKGDYSTDDLHEYFKDEYCPVKQITFGKKVKNVKSTKKLDTGEMHFYLQQIDMWAANAGFKLTIPVSSEYQELIDRQNQ